MLLQSHEGFIHLLPALPSTWTEGSFRNLRVRGGAAVSLQWKGGRAVQAEVVAFVPGTFVVKMPAGASQASCTVGGRTSVCTGSMITLDLKQGERCTLLFR